ncbi:MAG: hypothetical protein WC869_01280 [Phycisphaerae bacterium]|jgi:hypothetical protein
MPFYLDVDTLKIYEVITYPNHTANTETVIGVRDVGSEGVGPRWFAEYNRLGETQKDAIRLAKPYLEEQARRLSEEIKTLSRQRYAIDEYIDQIEPYRNET